MRPGSIGSFQPSRIANPSTPPPPGSPVFWFDGNDIDGVDNSTLVVDDNVSSWVSKGSDTTPATLPGGFAPAKYFVSASGHKALRDNVSALRVATGALPQPYMIAVVHFSSSDDGIFMAPAGSYTAGNAPRIMIKHTGFGNRWVMAADATEILAPIGSRSVTQIQVASALFNGASSILGVDHIADTAGSTGATGGTGVTLFGAGTTFSPNGAAAKLYQVLVYPDGAVTHAQIVAWAELVYGGTAPFTP